MRPVEAQKTANLLEKMAELELVISEFYKCTGERWKENEGFWFGLSQEEVSHAEYLRKMADILKGAPQQFEIGLPLTIASVSEVISGVKNIIQRLKNGEFSEKGIMLLARDLEQSLLESKFTEILRTTNIKYNIMILEIESQTETHRQLLINKIVDMG
jgi:hypothetical protein